MFIDMSFGLCPTSKSNGPWKISSSSIYICLWIHFLLTVWASTDHSVAWLFACFWPRVCALWNFLFISEFGLIMSMLSWTHVIPAGCPAYLLCGARGTSGEYQQFELIKEKIILELVAPFSSSMWKAWIWNTWMVAWFLPLETGHGLGRAPHPSRFLLACLCVYCKCCVIVSDLTLKNSNAAFVF